MLASSSLNSGVAMSLLYEMMGQVYDWVLTQMAGSYKFVIRDDKLGVQRRMKAIDAMPWQISLLGIHRART